MQALTNFRNPAPIPCSLRVTQRAQWYSCEQHCSARCYTNRRRHANAASGHNIYENEGRNTCAANDAFESTFSGSGNRYGSRQASRWGSPRASNALDIPPSPLAFAARAGGSTAAGTSLMTSRAANGCAERSPGRLAASEPDLSSVHVSRCLAFQIAEREP